MPLILNVQHKHNDAFTTTSQARVQGLTFPSLVAVPGNLMLC